VQLYKTYNVININIDRNAITSTSTQFKLMLQTSVFQPFCCSGTLHKCDNQSQNPTQWSTSPAA